MAFKLRKSIKNPWFKHIQAWSSETPSSNFTAQASNNLRFVPNFLWGQPPTQPPCRVRSEASATPAAAGAAVWQRHLGRLHLRHPEELAQGLGASDPAEAPITWSEKTSGGRNLLHMKLGKWKKMEGFSDSCWISGAYIYIYNYIYIYLKDLSKRFWGWFGSEDFIGPSRHRHFISPHWWSLLVEIT